MTTLFKQTTLASLLCAGLCVAPASQAAVTSETRQLAAFHAIEVSGPYKVIIKAQGTQAVELSGERKELDGIETVVKGDTLIVRPRSRIGVHFNMDRDDRAIINISTAGLRSLANSGSGDITLSQVDGEQFAVNMNGSGDVELFQLKTGSLNLAMRGSGDLSVTGSARTLKLDAFGSGDVEACDLTVERTSAKLRGSGDACVPGGSQAFEGEVDGSGELTVRHLRADQARLLVSGSGDIEIDGKVGKLSAKINGSGTLDGEDLLADSAEVVVRGSGHAELKLKSASAPGGEQLMHFDRKGSRPTRD